MKNANNFQIEKVQGAPQRLLISLPMSAWRFQCLKIADYGQNFEYGTVVNMRALHSILHMPEDDLNISEHISNKAQGEVTLTVNKYLLRDGRIQNPAKDLRQSALEK